MLTILLIGIAALLINIYCYFKELKGIWLAVKGKNKVQLQDEGLRLIQDIAVTGLVILLAGTGLYSFLIGSVGGALVSLFLWRKEVWAKITSVPLVPLST